MARQPLMVTFPPEYILNAQLLRQMQEQQAALLTQERRIQAQQAYIAKLEQEKSQQDSRVLQLQQENIALRQLTSEQEARLKIALTNLQALQQQVVTQVGYAEQAVAWNIAIARTEHELLQRKIQTLETLRDQLQQQLAQAKRTNHSTTTPQLAQTAPSTREHLVQAPWPFFDARNTAARIAPQTTNGSVVGSSLPAQSQHEAPPHSALASFAALGL